MKVISTQVLRGPNKWSNYRRKLIQLKLDLEEMEHYPTNVIPGFRRNLENLLPTLIEHECSESARGGFLNRVEKGTWLGHVLEHIALEIQTLAGMETGYGRTRGTRETGVYHVVFSYEIEQAGLYAAEAAFRIISALSAGQSYDLEQDLAELRRLKDRHGLGPSTKSIVLEAEKRNIPWHRPFEDSTILFGYGVNQQKIQATISSQTNALAVDAAGDKDDTKRLLRLARIPVPEGRLCYEESELDEIAGEIGFPMVIKPLNASKGRGATINIQDSGHALKALSDAFAFGRPAMVERYIPGRDFRMLVVNHRFVAAAMRLPAQVTGDGISTVRMLVEATNRSPERGTGHEKSLTQIVIDGDAEAMLMRQSLTPDSIPASGEIVVLKSTANLSTGGTAEDVTEEVHPDNIFLAERVSRAVGLDICGIDIMAPSLSEPIIRNGGAVIEVNAAPGFRMHLDPTVGKSRNVAGPVIDMLFPDPASARIPIIAVTGTNGKTTTTRLVAHMTQLAGYQTGYTTTDGIYIGKHVIEEGDTTGPLSGGVILRDPSVEFAVLETARGGILRSGLCFDTCDVGVITNIKEDHLGLNDIHTLDDLANVKAVVARSVKKDGWAVLNADDVKCVEIASELDCNVAFFSLDPENEIIAKHRAAGLPVAIVEEGRIVIRSNGRILTLPNIATIPIAIGGTARFMVANALAASLAAHLAGIDLVFIRRALLDFAPGPDQTPGRMNFFRFRNFEVLVDYAHNPHGYEAIASYLSTVQATCKTGIISGLGDRRDEDIRQCAAIAGQMFDKIIVRQEQSLRGRTEEAINNLILEGITVAGRDIPVQFISDEGCAIQAAMENPQKGELIVALSDRYQVVNAVVSEALKSEKNSVEKYFHHELTGNI